MSKYSSEVNILSNVYTKKRERERGKIPIVRLLVAINYTLLMNRFSHELKIIHTSSARTKFSAFTYFSLAERVKNFEQVLIKK